MIVFTGEDVEYSNRDAKRYDGVYYALILNSVLSSDGINYLCYVYIPEIFGDVDNSKGRLYYRCYDYVRVLVPDVSDNCDISDEDKERNKPSTGKIIKVAFDDGNINSCRYITSIPIDPLYEKMNYNYITEGILPSDILDITDPDIINTFKDLVPTAYYITTGHKGTKEDPVPKDCFKYKFVWSNTKSGKNSMDRFKNWFIEALTMPLQSYGGKNLGYSSANLPYYSTNVYNLLYAVQDMMNDGNVNPFKDLHNNVPTAEKYSNSNIPLNFDYKSSKLIDDSSRAKLAATWVLGLMSGFGPADPYYNTVLANIAFPDMIEEQANPNLYYTESIGIIDTYVELIWENFSYADRMYELNDDIKSVEKYRPHYILSDDKNRAIYEKHYISVLASWSSGVNTMLEGYDDKDNKFRNVILMCLTIVPWFANPLILYNAAEKSEAIRAMQKFINAMKNQNNFLTDYYDKYVTNIENVGNVEYSSIFPNQDAYLSFRKELEPFIKQGKIKGFVDKFQELTDKYLSDELHDYMYNYFDDQACAAKQFNEKFNRLKDIMGLN